MSILIRGMEMPKTCSDCDLYQYGFCMVTRNVCDKAWTQRQDDCPLIEVQSPHGRLIDADAFATNLKDISVRQGYKNTLIDEHLTVDDVFDSIVDELTGKAIYGFEYNPTIIEAEGSEE